MAQYTRYVEAHGAFVSYEDFYKNFRVRRPERFHFAFDVADVLAAETPDAPALVWAAPNGTQDSYTFAQMKQASDRAASLLRGLGVGKGDAVLLLLKTHHEYWPLVLALHKLGAVAAPCSTLLSAQDIAYRARNTRARLVVCTAEDGLPDRAEAAAALCPDAWQCLLVRGTRAGWHSYEALATQADPHFERPTGDQAVAPEDPMLLYFTSGTSGLPRMVTLDHAYPLAHIVTAVHWQRVTEGGLHLTLCDTGWSKSAWGQLYGQWLGGSGVFVWDAGDALSPDALLEAMARHGVTTLCAPPMAYRALLGADFSAHDLRALTHCTLTAEPLHPDIFCQWEEHTGLTLHEAYGLTETAVLVGNFAWGKVQPGSMGRPSPLYDVDVVDEHGKTCPPGVSGELVVRTHHGVPLGMFQGYANDEESTREAWHDGLFHTGDVAWRDEWGFYWYVSRADDVIRSSGYRIGPFEVEAALMEHPAVLEAAVTGVPDPLRHQVVKATVVLRPGYTPGDALARELQQHVKGITAPYKYPRIVAFAETLPRTNSGKLRRSALR